MSQLMSSFNLTIYPIIGLVIFLAAFTAICYRLFAMTPKGQLEREGQIPLEEGVANGGAGGGAIGEGGEKKKCSGECGSCQAKKHSHGDDGHHHRAEAHAATPAAEARQPAKARAGCCGGMCQSRTNSQAKSHTQYQFQTGEEA